MIQVLDNKWLVSGEEQKPEVKPLEAQERTNKIEPQLPLFSITLCHTIFGMGNI
jgi:hypothetical protein